MAWVVEFLNDEIRQLLDEFPVDIRASFQRIVELIQSHGLERVREPYVKHLEGALWEMRMKANEESLVQSTLLRLAAESSSSMSSRRRRKKHPAGKSLLP